MLLSGRATGSLVPNGDFETPTTALGQGVQPGTHIGLAGQGWTVVGSAPVDVHHVDNGSLWNHSQFLDLTGSDAGPGLYGGVVSDPIATLIGQQYRISFDAYNGSVVYPGTPYTGPAFSLQASGSLLQSYTLVPAGVNTVLTYYFTAISSATTLTFMDLTGFDSNAGWIDNVDLVAVPEPASVIAAALLLLPFGASTFRILRNHKQAYRELDRLR